MLKSEMTWYTLPRPIVGTFSRDEQGRAYRTTVIAFAFDGHELLWLTHNGVTIRAITADRFAE